MKAKNIKLSDNFYLYEFIPREFAMKYDTNFCRIMLNENIIRAAQLFRNITGKSVFVNTWDDGGVSNYSGVRPQNLKLGAPKSEHKVFINNGVIIKISNAVDLKCEGMSGKQMRELILANESQFRKYISRIEDGTSTWLHIDTKPTGNPEILVFPFWKAKQ